MTSILYEVAANVVDYTVRKNIVEIYGTNDDDYAFKACKNSLSSVLFETGSKLKNINQYSFYDCKELEKIELEKCSELVSIGDNAFYSCYMLKYIKLPESIQSIGTKAFYYCYYMNSLNFPSSLNSFGSKSFYECSSLLKVELKGQVTIIPNSCFGYCTDLKSVVLPSSVIEIQEKGFYNCNNLESINYPSSLKSLGRYCFQYCYKLNSFDIQEGLEYINDSAFYECGYLKTINLPSTLKNISHYAFFKCTNLSKVTISPDIKIPSFGDGEFKFSGIKTIQIPKSVIWISPSAFSGTYNLAKFEVVEGSKCYSTINGVLFNFEKTELVCYANGVGEEYNIPENTKRIGEIAFSYSVISKIVFPATLTHIDESAFRLCDNLETLNLNRANQMYIVDCYAFAKCSILKTVHISSSVDCINYDCFYYCKNLTTVTFEEGISSIGSNAFQNSKLQHIELPDSITDIGTCCFENCNSLNSIKLSAKLDYLNMELFSFTNFTKFVIPNHIKDIRDFCFKKCSLLKEVVLPSSLEKIGASIFQGCPDDIKITFAEGSKFKIIQKFLIVDTAETVAYQYILSTVVNVKIPSTVKIIKSKAFYSYEQLETVEFYGGTPQLEIIETEAFQMCIKLKSFGECPKLYTINGYAFEGTAIENLNFCPNVATIGSHSFNGCKNLVTIPNLNNLTSLKTWYSFGYCSNLKTIGEMNKLEYINENSFIGCSLLEQFPVCPNLKLVDNEAFKYCYSLKEFVFGGSINKIRYDVFAYCYNLSKITFLAATGSELYIEERAFDKCYFLKEVIMNKDSNLIFIGQYAFRSTGLSTFYFPCSLKEIEPYAFLNSSINTLDSAKDGVLEVVPDHCFENCTNLVSATLPDSVANISRYAFNETGLVSFTVPKCTKTFEARVFEKCTNLKEFIIPDGSQLETIGYKIFSQCSSMKTFISKSENFIVFQDALLNKEKSRIIGFPPASQITKFVMPQSVKYVAPSAFYSCNNLVVVELPKNSVEQIDFSAFDSCLNLVEITIPSSLTQVGNNAFVNCPKLKCGQKIENPTPEVIDMLVNIGGMSEYAANPCKNTDRQQVSFADMKITLLVMCFIIPLFL